MTAERFDICEICGENNWSVVYSGPVRDGSFGRVVEGAVVAECGKCGVERLDEGSCHDESLYVDEAYRQLLDEGEDAVSFLAQHDPLQLRNVTVLQPHRIRNCVVADIGAAAGSLLDHLSGLAAATVAVEPCIAYHDSLRSRFHEVFAFSNEVTTARGRDIDLATSFSVIEHVRDPRAFLADIAAMLKPDGEVLISTPNRNDILMELLPDEYPAFFYRTVHRWYFNAASLEYCALAAGLELVEMRVCHRFGLGNAMGWLRDRRPQAEVALPFMDSSIIDVAWRASLDAAGRGDYLYATFRQRA